jgi:transforming growth factor-beta-induced protein
VGVAACSPFTVFAPTNEAFAALPAGVLANLLKPANKQQLVDLLTYHVVSGKVLAYEVWGPSLHARMY